MANKGRSERGLFGTINHYDSKGKKIGRSEPSLFGGYTNYDASRGYVNDGTQQLHEITLDPLE